MTITEKVKFILSRSKASRSSDKLLLVYFMQKHGLGLSDGQIEAFLAMPSFETVRRVRQKIQEGGEYLPLNPEVARARRLKSYEMQQNTPSAGPETIERILES